MKFQVIFTYDPEYEGYIADVPVLNGCMSQGKTIEEAMENIKDAIKSFLEVQTEHGIEYIENNYPVFIAEVAI